MCAIPRARAWSAARTGDANAAIAGAAKVHGSEFTSDYVYHAQMEPHVCVASVTPNGVEVWTGTQWQTRPSPRRRRPRASRPEKVTLHQMQMGGSFGRNIFVEYVIDAVNLSKAAGKPVKMIQSRSDDVVHGRFRPMYAQRIEVGLDAGGKVVGWRHRIAADTVVPYLYGQARMDTQKGIDHIVFAGADVPHYDVPAHVADHIYEERGVRTAPWRGIGAGATNFAIEVVIDELAQLAGQDPLAYRLALLKDPRAKRVVETAAKMADWGRKRDGTALGISFGKLGLPPIGFSLVGTVAEVSIDRASGRINCHNLWCAADVGLPVQPEQHGRAARELADLCARQRAQGADHDPGRRRAADELPRLRDPAAVGDSGDQGGCHPLRRHSVAGRRARDSGRGAGGQQCGVRADRTAAAQRAVHAQPRQGGAGIAEAISGVTIVARMER